MTNLTVDMGTTYGLSYRLRKNKKTNNCEDMQQL